MRWAMSAVLLLSLLTPAAHAQLDTYWQKWAAPATNLSAMVDVRQHFGARCDGKSDDSTAIQAAIDHVSAAPAVASSSFLPGRA